MRSTLRLTEWHIANFAGSLELVSKLLLLSVLLRRAEGLMCVACVAGCRGQGPARACSDSEACIHVLSRCDVFFDLLLDACEGQVRSLQEILVNLILHELLESVTDALSI